MAIQVAHRLQEMEIPVYFASLREIKRKDDLLSKILSIFVDAGRTFMDAHWLIHILLQIQNPFVLILDNADMLLDSEDANLKEDVLRFIEEILGKCSHIKLLFTTREPLNYLSHKHPIRLERVDVLDEAASGELVNILLPDISEPDCNNVVKECGQVPRAIQLMCSALKEHHVLAQELLKESKRSSFLEVFKSRVILVVLGHGCGWRSCIVGVGKSGG